MSIIQNAFRVKETGEIFRSCHVHDFQGVVLNVSFLTSIFVSVDGGHEYFRSSGLDDPRVEDLRLTDEMPKEIIRAELLWGTRGKSGKDPLKWVVLNECETDHLQAILKNANPDELHRRVIEDILKERRVVAGEEPMAMMEEPQTVDIGGRPCGGGFVTLDSGQRVEYPSGMRRDVTTGKPRYDLIPREPLRRLAELYARGAEKYGDENWQLANTPEELARFRASAFRHFMQWANGEEDEDHGIAVVWNIFAHLVTKDKCE